MIGPLGVDAVVAGSQVLEKRAVSNTRGLGLTMNLALFSARWVLVVAIGAWAFNQLSSAFDVLAIKLGDAVSAGINPSLIIVVETMGPLLVLLTVANAVCYAASTVLLALRYAAVLPVYTAAVVFDLTGWVVYSSNSTYDLWVASTPAPADWVVNGLLLVGLIVMIILRQAGAIPRHLFRNR